MMKLQILIPQYKETDEIIKLDYIEDGVNKTLKFNVQTGKSNVIDCV